MHSKIAILQKTVLSFCVLLLLTVCRQCFNETAVYSNSGEDKACFIAINKDQGPNVQSIVSLTSSLRSQLVKCFTIS